MRASIFGSSRPGGWGVNGAADTQSGMFGIGLAFLAYALFSVHDATIKWLVASLPTWEVLFFRSLAISIACVVIGRRRLLERAISSPMKAPLAFRGLITLTAWICFYTAARSLSLAQLWSLYFAAPLMITMMAVPLLGETVTRTRWLTVLLGFAGVLVVTDPWGVPLSVPTLLVLLAAAQWGYGVILMRQIARRESSLVQIFFINVIFLIGTGIGCAFVWQTPTLTQCVLLGLVALFGGVAQFSLFEAARHAPASVMATVEYTALIWAFTLGFLIWGNIPRPATFLGAGIILCAGAVLFFGERRSARLLSAR